MNISRFIARRYLLSKKSKSIINIISFISVIGIFVSSASMVIVLSGFNGIEGLVASLYSEHNADLIITPKKGKTFIADSVLISKLNSFSEISNISRVIEEITMLKKEGGMNNKKDRWVTATMKGVEASYEKICQINSSLDKGKSNLYNNNIPQAIIGIGLQFQLNGYLNSTIKVYGLLRNEKLSNKDTTALQYEPITIGGVFNINPELNYQTFIVPIEFAQNLLNYNDEITSIELEVAGNSDVNKVKNELLKIIGDEFIIKTNFEKNELLFKTNATEKWMVFLILIFILILSTFNIIASLTMLILDKKKDISTLISLGATHNLIRNIFFKEGLYINLIGGILGLCFGVAICLLQKNYHLIKLENSVVPYWPVDIEWVDLFSISTILLVIGLISSFVPTTYLIKKHFKHFFY